MSELNEQMARQTDTDGALPDLPAAVVTFKRNTNPVHVELDMQKLGWEEMKRIRAIQKEMEADDADEIELIDKLVEIINMIAPIDIRTLPMLAMNEVIRQVVSQFGNMVDQKN